MVRTLFLSNHPLLGRLLPYLSSCSGGLLFRGPPIQGGTAIWLRSHLPCLPSGGVTVTLHEMVHNKTVEQYQITFRNADAFHQFLCRAGECACLGSRQAAPGQACHLCL
jgi:hypothetical protein